MAGMAGPLSRLQRWAQLRSLSRQIRQLQATLDRQAQITERMAQSLEQLTLQATRFVEFHVPRPPADGVDPLQAAQAQQDPAVDVSWVTDDAVADWQRMEQTLTKTLGTAPTDEQVYEAFKREDRLPGRGPGSFPRINDLDLGGGPQVPS